MERLFVEIRVIGGSSTRITFVQFVPTPTRILIIRFSSIGDIVLTTPIIRALKQQLDGEVEIDFITKEAFAPIVNSNPHVNELITIKQNVFEQKERLQNGNYDYVIDLHSNIRSGQVKRLVKALTFTIDKRNFAKWLYVNTKKEILPIGHVVDRCFQAVAPLGVEDDCQGLDYFIPEADRINRSDLPSAFQSGYVVYAIGGQMKGKILPTEKAIDLCGRVGRPIILLGGEDDEARGEEIANACSNHVWNACGKYSLNQSASLLDQSDCVISHDTGLMHIAAALKKTVISLWFATTPEIGFAPWQPGDGSVMIEADCKKRPTSKLGNRGYEDGCVFEVDLGEISNSVNE